MKRITDALPKQADEVMINIKGDPIKYGKLKAKLKKQKVTVKDFWETSVDLFLAEK